LTKDVESSLLNESHDRESTLKIFGVGPNAKSGDLLFYLADSIALSV
jgi:hypothetical protein